MFQPWWRIAWRNLGRNRRRTTLTAAGLALGYFGTVLIAGLSKGIVAQMIANGTGLVTGQVQVHDAEYLPDRSLYDTIGRDAGTDVAALLSAAQADPDVEAVAPRVFAGGLVGAAAATNGAMLMGVDPSREAAVSRLPGTLEQGRMPRADVREIVLGRELARQIDAQPGDEVVVVAPAADGSIGNDLFTVSGIFATGLSDLDGAMAVLAIGPLQSLLALPPNRVHEVALRVADPWRAPAVAARLDSVLTAAVPSVAVEPWTIYRPEMVDYAHLVEGSQWIVLVVVFAMAIFGVANTMLMTTFERRREFAVVLALGASPRGLVGSIAAEAAAMGAVAMLLGAIITVPVLVWWHHAPPDLSALVGGFSMAGAFVRPVLQVDYPAVMIVEAGVALVATALLAAVYPAVRAARVPPADTLAGR